MTAPNQLSDKYTYYRNIASWVNSKVANAGDIVPLHIFGCHMVFPITNSTAAPITFTEDASISFTANQDKELIAFDGYFRGKDDVAPADPNLKEWWYTPNANTQSLHKLPSRTKTFTIKLKGLTLNPGDVKYFYVWFHAAPVLDAADKITLTWTPNNFYSAKSATFSLTQFKGLNDGLRHGYGFRFVTKLDPVADLQIMEKVEVYDWRTGALVEDTFPIN